MLGQWAVFRITCTLIVNMCGMSLVCHVLHYITSHYITLKINTLQLKSIFGSHASYEVRLATSTEVYFRSSRSKVEHHVVPSAISSGTVYASRAKQVLTGLLSALASRRGRISVDIVRGRWAPPCCAVDPFNSRRVHIAGEAGESQRVSVAGPHGPAKTEFLSISAGEDAVLCRRPFHQPTCTCCRQSRLSSAGKRFRSSGTGEACFLPHTKTEISGCVSRVTPPT